MPEFDLLQSPASSQQPQGKKRKQSPSSSPQQEELKYRHHQPQPQQQQPQQQQQQVQQKQHYRAQQSLFHENYSQAIPAQFPTNNIQLNNSILNTPPSAITTSPSTNKRPRSSIGPTAEIYKARYSTAAPPQLVPPPMLNFSNHNNVIDLTDSPPSSQVTKNATVSASISANNMVSAKAPKYTIPPHSTPRKLIVKNLRQRSGASWEVYYEQTWKSLDAALTSIFNGQLISTSLEELYRGTENLCRGDRAPSTYEKLRARCDAYLSSQLKEELNERVARSDDEVVKAVEAGWTKWCGQLNIIRSIFFYLDRSYLLSTPNMGTIWDTGLDLFRTHIASDSRIGPRFLRGIFTLFEKDRQSQGEVINMSLLLSCIRMITNLGLYSSDFEPKFINVSREYFSRLAKQESQSQNLAGYLAECTSQLEQESLRCEKFQLDLSTKREIVSVLEQEMVHKQISVLVDVTSVGELLGKKDLQSLTRLYSLLDRVGDAGALIKPAWENYITTEGSAIIQNEQIEVEMVPRLLEFKGSLDKICADPFKKNDDLAFSLRDAFSTFINARNPNQKHANNSKPAEMIAKYVDLLLRSGVKAFVSRAGDNEGIEKATVGDEDAELATQLENVLDLFRFIHGKDVFEAFYKKDLARRLLMGRSASADAERSMLTKLKTECGSGFTHNLERMFKDIELSKETMTSFKASRVGLDKSRGVDLNVHILSMSSWPTYLDIPVSLPEGLAEYLEVFKDFYLGKHKGRKLMWRHALTQCVLKANFPKGKKELVVSAFQAVVLLLFNSINPVQSLSYTTIMEATGLPDREIIRTLQSLACGKHRVLRKHPKGADVNPTDTFTLNEGFKDEKFRIKINQIQLKETKEENKETHERVAQDRQYETQAAIIRIMKARKTIKHVELIQQTIEQTKNRGVLDISEIKQNIEKLIDKEYMERLEDDTYHYVS